MLRVRYIDVPGTMGRVVWQKKDEIRTQEGDRIFADGKPCKRIADIPDSALSVAIVSVPAAPAALAVVAIIGGILAVGGRHCRRCCYWKGRGAPTESRASTKAGTKSLARLTGLIRRPASGGEATATGPMAGYL